jgi:methionyl-tRNA formyltransferase
MRILFAGHKTRGLTCLEAVRARGHDIVAVVGHPVGSGGSTAESVAAAGRALGVPVFEAEDINSVQTVRSLQALHPDVLVLAGYGPILRGPVIDIASRGCVNLHGGRLPQYRGSSPLNWALINGETEFAISIIRVDAGIDSGDVLLDRTFPIGPDDTIADLHRIANANFPDMLVEVLEGIGDGTAHGRKQDPREAAYYPLRFPDDGLILWDLATAPQAHNRIRALTDPYPGAFTFLGSRRVRVLRSKAAARTYHGEPGRVYLKNEHGLLVCASDRCLWITRAVFEDDGADAIAHIARYQVFATVRGLALAGGLAAPPVVT